MIRILIVLTAFLLACGKGPTPLTEEHREAQTEVQKPAPASKYNLVEFYENEWCKKTDVENDNLCLRALSGKALVLGKWSDRENAGKAQREALAFAEKVNLTDTYMLMVGLLAGGAVGDTQETWKSLVSAYDESGEQDTPLPSLTWWMIADDALGFGLDGIAEKAVDEIVAARQVEQETTGDQWNTPESNQVVDLVSSSFPLTGGKGAELRERMLAKLIQQLPSAQETSFSAHRFLNLVARSGGCREVAERLSGTDALTDAAVYPLLTAYQLLGTCETHGTRESQQTIAKGFARKLNQYDHLDLDSKNDRRLLNLMIDAFRPYFGSFVRANGVWTLPTDFDLTSGCQREVAKAERLLLGGDRNGAKMAVRTADLSKESQAQCVVRAVRVMIITGDVDSGVSLALTRGKEIGSKNLLELGGEAARAGECSSAATLLKAAANLASPGTSDREVLCPTIELRNFARNCSGLNAPAATSTIMGFCQNFGDKWTLDGVVTEYVWSGAHDTVNAIVQQADDFQVRQGALRAYLIRDDCDHAVNYLNPIDVEYGLSFAWKCGPTGQRLKSASLSETMATWNKD